VGLRGLPVPHVPEVRMSGWKITLHEKRPENPQVGDMWPAPWLRREEPPQPCFFLSPRYVREHAHRPPLVVRLPGPVDFCVDQPEWDANGVHGDGWGCAGEAPNLTLSPSINIGGIYHGWIRDGVITPDCEGRTFPNATQ
jgi:hypothetical protein